jgi:hypothetical protein
MWAAEVARAIGEHAWLAPLPLAVWFMQRTRIARTAAWILRVSAWDALLRFKGVPEDERRRLVADAAQRDLESW